MINFLIVPQAIITEWLPYHVLYDLCAVGNRSISLIDRSFTMMVAAFDLTVINYVYNLVRHPQKRTLQYTLRTWFWFLVALTVDPLVTIIAKSEEICLRLSYSMSKGDGMPGKEHNQQWLDEH